MALLGAQLVITLVIISIIQKLGPYFSLGKWFLCSTGLVRYLYPTDSELRRLANIPKEKPKGKKPGKNGTQNGKQAVDTFHIERSLDVTLETSKVCYLDVIHLKYYTEYQWLVDFSLYAAMVYLITEVYQIWFPIKDEVNLSMIWCILVVLWAIKHLLTLTIQYFRGEESVGERSTCIVMGFIYLLIAMMILIVDERTLEFGLENAYSSFNQSAHNFLSQQGLSSTGPASKIVLKFFLAVSCATLGAICTFPGLRIAKMHWDLLRYFNESRAKQALLNLSFALPFLLVTLWIKPVTKDLLTVRIYSGRDGPLMTESSFEIARLLAIIFTMCLKIILMPWYLQAYLDMAYHRTEEQKKEAGRITNVEYQKKIAAVFYYLCVVTLQYLTPIIICLYFSLMYKTLGEYQWTSLYKNVTVGNLTVANDTAGGSFDLFRAAQSEGDGGSIGQTAEAFHLKLESLKAIFTASVFKGLLSFATWWSCFLYFATTSVGLVYQSYFSRT